MPTWLGVDQSIQVRDEPRRLVVCGMPRSGMTPVVLALEKLFHCRAEPYQDTTIHDLTYTYRNVLNVRALQETKIVFVVRNPQEIRKSWNSLVKSLGDDQFVDISFDLIQVRSAQLAFHQNPTQVHVIVYEELVAHPEQVLTRLCSFLSIECDARNGWNVIERRVEEWKQVKEWESIPSIQPYSKLVLDLIQEQQSRVSELSQETVNVPSAPRWSLLFRRSSDAVFSPVKSVEEPSPSPRRRVGTQILNLVRFFEVKSSKS